MKVYLGEYIHPEAESLLADNTEIVRTFDNPEELDAVLVRTLPITKELMQRASKLKIISKHGVGCDNIDLNAAKELGITVANTPTANTNSVAELIVGLALSLCRHIPTADRKCRFDEYTGSAPKELTGTELTGKVLGLVGMGNISKRVAEILHNGFGMTVIGYDHNSSDEKAKKIGCKRVDTIEELIENSHLVNISVPLNEETKNLISGNLFDKFNPDAILINAARGGIVNEDDLYAALRGGKLKAAACDVFAVEPPTSKNKLLTLDNFVATPHLGAATEDALYRMGTESVQAILTVLNGGQPAHRVV